MKVCDKCKDAEDVRWVNVDHRREDEKKGCWGKQILYGCFDLCKTHREEFTKYLKALIKEYQAKE